jgi:two-component system, NtrC family, sensor histidine kinase HydH
MINIMNGLNKKFWAGIPPWIILGAVIVLVPIFVFWTMENISKQKENTIKLLTEKGAALIRSFEAGARTGMMGMMGMRGNDFRLQNLLKETAQQPDIIYLIVTDEQGIILAHNDPEKIGKIHGTNLNLKIISGSQDVAWRHLSTPGGPIIFEVFRKFSPTSPPFRGYRGREMGKGWYQPLDNKRGQSIESLKIIFVGLDMGPIEDARKEDTHHTVIMSLILLLIGFAGIVFIFLANAYRSTKTSLTKIKAFSDTIVENMPIGLVALDADLRIASFNQTAGALLRLESREVLGKQPREILPEAMQALLDELKGKRGIIEKEINCTFGEGKSVPLDVGVASMEEEGGTFLGNVLFFRDLTEVQELKNEIETSRRLASLGKLAAGIAHELRNPLSSIKGFATYFQERYKAIPEDQKTAEIMIQEVERLNRVIGQLQEFARPMKIHKKPVSLQSLIQHSLNMIERDAKAKDISIQTDLPQEVKEISLDQDSISQVLLNLFINSLQAMDREGTLSVRLLQDENSETIKIIVSDTGSGIKQQDLAHIFDPYFTTKQSGTGLGLAIVHKIIRAHGGEVRVESEQGKGSIVYILLPFS